MAVDEENMDTGEGTSNPLNTPETAQPVIAQNQPILLVRDAGRATVNVPFDKKETVSGGKYAMTDQFGNTVYINAHGQRL